MKDLFKFYLKHEFLMSVLVGITSVIIVGISLQSTIFPLLNNKERSYIHSDSYEYYGLPMGYEYINDSPDTKEYLNHILKFLHKPPSQTLIEPCKKVLENIKEKKLSTNIDIIDYIFNSGEVVPVGGENFNKKAIISDKKDIEIVFSWLAYGQENCKKDFLQINKIIKNQIGELRFSQNFADVNYNTYFGGLIVIMFYLCIFFNKDKSANMLQLICSKPLSDNRYLISRYFCQLIYFIISQLIGFFALSIFVCYKSSILGFEYNVFDFISYYFVYNLPTNLYISAIALLFSVIFKKLVWAMLFSYSYIYIMFRSFDRILFSKNIVLKYIKIIFNFYLRKEYCNKFAEPDVILNRISTTIFSVILIFISCYIWKKTKKNIS